VGRSFRGSRGIAGVAVALGVAALLRVAYDGWYLNYDARYALLWARDIVHGFSPEFGAPLASAPHPLSIAWSFLALPFGHGGDQVVVWIVLLSFGAVVWLTYRIGATLFSPWAGAAAALIVFSRPVLVRDAVSGFQDVPFAALILAAVLLEAQRRRRGWPVLALLALAGLIRPEAWLLSVLYLAYMWKPSAPRRRALFAALAVAGPLLWTLMDLIVTGDPFHSLHSTANVAAEAGVRHGVTQAPEWTVRYFGAILREPGLLAVAIGAAFAWRYRRAQAALPLVVAGVLTAVFAAGPIFGLPLVARYLRTPGVLLALFAGLALFAWQLVPPGRDRRPWAIGAVLAAGGFLAFLPSNVSQLHGVRTRSLNLGRFYGDLRRVGDSPAVRRAFAACAPLQVSDHRPVPYIRYWLDGDPGSVRRVPPRSAPTAKLLLLPRHSKAATRFYQQNFPKVQPPAGYRAIYLNRTWRVYAAPACAA
jgi:hypothetical protein